MHAIHSLRKTINYFISKGNTVNLGVIDLHKAFDKTNHFGILNILQKQNIHFQIIDVLQTWMISNKIKVNWNNNLSNIKLLDTGIRQGGIPSPILF